MRLKNFYLISIFFILTVISSISPYASEHQKAGNSISQPQSDPKIAGKIKNLKGKLESLEEKLFRKIDGIEQKIKNEVEILSAKSLHEFAKEKLETADYTYKTIIALIAVIGIIGTGAAFVIRHLLIRRIEEFMSKMIKESEEYMSKIDNMIKENSELKMHQHRLFAYSYNIISYDAWADQNYKMAIDYAEMCVKCSTEAWPEGPKNENDQRWFNVYRSNLAYYYAEQERDDMKGRTIEYAKMGLQTGKDTEELDLIDSFLYVIMKFSKETKDKKEWLKIFEAYKEDIFKQEIRKPGEEQNEFIEYYLKVKKELKPENAYI